jgi:hypothetical protein
LYSITFTTPNLGSDLKFGIAADIQVFWKQVQSRARVVGKFVYGATVNAASFTPSNLHYGGGDKIQITTCGMANFNNTNLALLFGSTAICNRGAGIGSDTDTLTISANADGTETLSCVSNSVSCSAAGSPYTASVTISNLPSPIAAGTVVTLPSTANAINVTVGPQITVNTFRPTRGARLGGTVVAVDGSYFTNNGNSTWPVSVTLTTLTAPIRVLGVVPATVVDDQHLTFVTPPGLFGLDVSASFQFGSDAQCTGRIATLPTFHYGPMCSAVSPAFGSVVGGDRVTISGAGFLEDGEMASDIDVRFCIQRLAIGQLNNCTAEPHSRSDFVVEDNSLVVSTPSWRQNVVTPVGGNRLFGDKADVFVYFRAPGSTNGNYGTDFNIALLAPGMTQAVIRCPVLYTFGPQVQKVTPNKAQNGNLPSTVVTASGVAFSDSFFSAGSPAVAFNNQLGANSVVAVDPSNATTKLVTTNTIGGETANTIANVQVTFNTCNQTASSTTVTWGPTVGAISCSTCDTTGAEVGILFGLLPSGGQTITVAGSRFNDFLSGGNFSASCMIHNVQSPATYVSPTQLTCVTPAGDFGSRAPVTILFGTICGDAKTPIDWRQSVSSSMRLHYGFRLLTGVSPTFGPASGGTTVTLTAAGLRSFTNPKAFFGNYAAGSTTAAGNVITTVTPLDRAAFNTDVTIYLQVQSSNNDFAWRVKHPNTFHYGPMCTDVVPSVCAAEGCAGVYLSGSGFRDCNLLDADTRNCLFSTFQIEYVDAAGAITVVAPENPNTLAGRNDNTHLYYTAPPAQCGFRPQVQIRFLDAVLNSNGTNQNVVQCNPARAYDFHYGPLVTSTASTFYDASTDRHYGWQGDSITLTGVNFNTTANGAPVSCNFRNTTGYVGSSVPQLSSNTTIVCPVPEGAFDSYVDVTVAFQLGACEIAAAKFHYGPVLRSSSPSRGYVAGGAPFTITGFALTCCGISSVQMLFPGGVATSATLTSTTVMAPVPANNQIDLLLNNIGVRFTSTRFPATVNNQYSSVATELPAASSLRYYYGPTVSSISPAMVTLSGRDQIVTINGAGFADPYFTDVFCDYFAVPSNSSNTSEPRFLGSVKLLPSEKTDSQLLCRVLEFSHNCGDMDYVVPRWRRFNEETLALRPEQGRFYWKTVAPAARSFSTPTATDGGSMTRAFFGTVRYGFSVVSVSGTTNVAVAGGSNLTVTASNLRDYYSNTTTRDFGPGNALCLFGNYRSPALASFTATQDGVANTVFTCVVPAAPLGYSAVLSVLLNPNENTDTKLTNAFEWVPQATSLSRTFGASAGGDVVVVRGNGFCRYSTVTCYFAGQQAIRSDITNDNAVTCVTPPNAPSTVSVELRFCTNGVCMQLNSLDSVMVPAQFTYIGITSLSTRSGSICGFNKVQFNGYGFTFFDSVQCEFEGQRVPATIVSDNAVQCRSIDWSSQVAPEQRASFCGVTRLIGTRRGRDYTIDSPVPFQFGYPEVQSISPASADLDALPTLITIRGQFFDGGRVVDSYEVGSLISRVLLCDE